MEIRVCSVDGEKPLDERPERHQPASRMPERIVLILGVLVQVTSLAGEVVRLLS